MNKRQITIILFAIFALQFFLIAGLWHQRPFLDEGRYLTTGWMILNGRIPFIDTLSPKPPAIEFLLASVFYLFGTSMLAARLFIGLVAVLQLALIFVLAKKVFGEKAALLAVLFYSLWSLGFSSYWATIEPFTALISTAAVLFAYLFVFENQSKKNVFALGLFLGLDVVFKQTMLPFAFLITAAVAILNYYRNRQKPSLQTIAAFAAGMLLVPLVFLAYFLANNALPAFAEAILSPLSQLIFFSVLTIETRLLIAIAAFSPVIVVIAALSKNLFSAREKTLEIILILCWFAFSFSNLLPFRGCCLHLLLALPPASILAGYLIWQSLSCKKEKAVEAAFCAFCTGLLILSVFAAGFFYYTLSGQEYSFAGVEKVALFVQSNTSEEETILVLPSSPELYFLSRRMPGAREISNWNCLTPCQEGMLEDMVEMKPKLIVYFSSKEEDPESGMTLVDAFIKENYKLLTRLEISPPLYKAYEHAFVFQRGD